MNRSDISLLNLSTGEGQEKALSLMKEMLKDCSRLRSENLELRSQLSVAESSILDASSMIDQAKKKITELTRQNSEMHSLLQSAAIQLSALSSTNERLLEWLEMDLGIGDLLATEVDEWNRIRSERAWIEHAWQIFSNLV